MFLDLLWFASMSSYLAQKRSMPHCVGSREVWCVEEHSEFSYLVENNAHIVQASKSKNQKLLFCDGIEESLSGLYESRHDVGNRPECCRLPRQSLLSDKAPVELRQNPIVHIAEDCLWLEDRFDDEKGRSSLKDACRSHTGKPWQLSPWYISNPAWHVLKPK